MSDPLSIQAALALHQAGRLADAEVAYRRILSVNPADADALHLLGLLARQTGNIAAAIELLTRAVESKPDFAAAHGNLGSALMAGGRHAEAIAALERSLQLDSRSPETHTVLGNALYYANRLDEAVASHQRAIALRPSFAEAHNNLAAALVDLGDRPAAVAALRQAINFKPALLEAHGQLVYSLQFLEELDAATILRETQAWDLRHARALTDAAPKHAPDRSTDRRLRIGYVSPHFRDHCQALFMVPLLQHHDHQGFEIFCYSSVSRPDAVTRRLTSHADQWRDAARLSDDQLAQGIRADRIDILVDLTMHMTGGRPLLFARKPAPIQVAFLAYPGTTGLSAMDYRLTDPHLDPPGETDQYYSEKSIRLADTFWCYDPLTDALQPGNPPSAGGHSFTFGCLNNPSKLSARTLELWALVLLAVPNSRLLLLAPEGSTRRKIIDYFNQRGIAPERIEFVAEQPRAKYLAEYQHIDLCLDTLPYNGHTTSLDSFWMGVPVVSRVGSTVVGRAGLSQLKNLGLSELAAFSDDDFVRIAANLAADTPRLSQLRSTLRGRMEKSPLMDAAKFARDIENAYREMWQRWCNQRQAPQ